MSCFNLLHILQIVLYLRELVMACVEKICSFLNIPLLYYRLYQFLYNHF